MEKRMKPKWTTSILCAGLFLLCAAPAFPDTGAPLWERITLSGFGTLGLVTAAADDVGFRRDMNQDIAVFDQDIRIETDSLLGIQTDIRLTPDLDAGVQFVLRHQADMDIENSLHLAFLRYRFTPQVTVRAGRMGIDVYMLSDYRNVGFAYPWVRPAPGSARRFRRPRRFLSPHDRQDHRADQRLLGTDRLHGPGHVRGQTRRKKQRPPLRPRLPARQPFVASIPRPNFLNTAFTFPGFFPRLPARCRACPIALPPLFHLKTAPARIF